MLTVVFCIFSDILDHSPDHTAVQLGDDVTGDAIWRWQSRDSEKKLRSEQLRVQMRKRGVQM